MRHRTKSKQKKNMKCRHASQLLRTQLFRRLPPEIPEPSIKSQCARGCMEGSEGLSRRIPPTAFFILFSLFITVCCVTTSCLLEAQSNCWVRPPKEILRANNYKIIRRWLAGNPHVCDDSSIMPHTNRAAIECMLGCVDSPIWLIAARIPLISFKCCLLL